jgi:hypothetical protein
MNGESERAWKEVIMAYFKVLCWLLPAEMDENPHKG